MKQNRFKSKVVWLSLASAVYLIYNTLATEFGWLTITDTTFNTVINALLGIFVTFGILNDPTSSDKF